MRLDAFLDPLRQPKTPKYRVFILRMGSVLSMVCVWDAYGIETPKSEHLLSGSVRFDANLSEN